MLSGCGRYKTFGFRKVWLDYFFSLGEAFWNSDKLGNRQFESLRCWLKDAEITASGRITETGTEMRRLGADDNRVWAVIWTNLAFNAEIADTYVRRAVFNREYTRPELLDMIGARYPLASRRKIVSSLLETLKHSPIGADLGNGVCSFSGRCVRSVTRTGWRNADDMCVLYALRKCADQRQEAYLDISRLGDDMGTGVTPQQLFGVGDIAISYAASRFAERHPDVIAVAGSTIRFAGGHRPVDILKMMI